ncbi:hypothetical protein HXX76_012934 [Chlamydomonas incerta]|uniref:Uncharacterized protein n=1 Tax=Chlamydomonas incerta TaxID=51695 RepID=A0A835SQX0_CHLIN|nr:hypothetical protein HXX76_012934 [Chlamydomonas incerta]|eukprot:KAG2426619.1 hypothetical protein HXX76_012934 [Chlamydomonas incerta]
MPRSNPPCLLLLAGLAAALLLCAAPTAVRAEVMGNDDAPSAAPGGAGVWGLHWLSLPLLRGGALPARLAPATAGGASGPAAAAATAGTGGAGVRLARRLLSPWVARGVSRPICSSPAVLCSSAWSLDGTWVKANYKIAENEPKAGAAGGGAGRSTLLGAVVSRGL